MEDRKLLRLFLKILAGCIIFCWFCVAVLHFALVYIASSPSTKDKIISSLKEQTCADVSIGSMSASIFDLKISDVHIGIDNKNIADVDTLYVRFSLIHLIKGKLKINNITVDNLSLTIIKDKFGKFNFDPVLKSPAFTPAEEPEPKQKEKDEEDDDDVFDISVCKFQFSTGRIAYIDEQEEISAAINEMYMDVENFNLEEVFNLNFYLIVSLKTKDVSVDDLHITLTSRINLNSLMLSQAEFDIDKFSLRLKDTSIITKGKIVNFENPEINSSTKISNFSSQTFTGIAEVPEFLIPEINIEKSLNINLEKSLMNIKKISVNVLDCNIAADGKLDYSKDLKYDINLIINLVLDKICQTIELTKPYKPAGSIQSRLNITSDSSVVAGTLSLVNIYAFLPQLGDITEINSDITIKNIDDVNMPKLTGKINSYPFIGSASYLANDKKGKLKANFFADRIYGKMSKEYEQQQKKSAETKNKEKTLEKVSEADERKVLKDFNEQKVGQEIKNNKNISLQAETKSSFKPIDAEVFFKVNHINVPYFLGKDVKFTMDMHNITPELDDIEGILNLTTADGTIKDIYKLTESNALMKGMFLSLRVVSNVVNALNVLDILNSIGSAVVSSSKDKKQVSEMTYEDAENRKEKLDGQIDFLSFITSMDFKQGKGVFKSCSFVSNLMSFKVAGNIDFKKNLVDMAVNAAPGRHEEDEGIMPLKMNISGTTDEPSGSLSLLGSVSSLVSDALTKNIVSGSLKSGFSKLLGLKKYDENGNDIVEPELKNKKKKKNKNNK